MLVPSMRHCAAAEVSLVRRDGFDVEVDVGEPRREPLDVGGERVAADRAAGGGVLVGAVVGERGHHGFAIVAFQASK